MTQKETAKFILDLYNQGNADIATDKSGYIVFQHDISAIFEKVKEYSSYKSKFIPDANGISVFDRFTLTDEEYNIWKQFLKSSAEDIHRQLGYIAKDIGKSLIFDYGQTAHLYSATETYGIGHYVADKNYEFVYKSLVASNVGNPLTDSTKWERQDREMTIPPYVSTQTYAIDDLVLYNDKYYMSLENNNTNNQPDQSSTWWIEVPELIDTKNKITIVLWNLKNFDPNAVSIMDDKIFQIYVAYTLKEWFKISGLMNDYQLEEAKIQNLMLDLRVLSFRRIAPMYRTGRVL